MEQDDSTPEGEQISGNLVTVCRFIDPAEAMVARGALESAGIDVFLLDENVVRIYASVVGGIRLQVANDNVEAAKAILSQPIPESFSIDDGSIYEQPKCPHCQSLDVSFSLMQPVDARTCHACGLLWQDDADESSDID